jgi:hypothetical protein
MKKFIFAALAVVGLISCDPTVKEGKCTDITELQEAINKGTSDTARYDINGDGEINIADINALMNSQPADSTAVENKDSI